jgi:hypothetical protein
MALYLIGDVQGCDAALVRLLQQIDFSPSRDTLYMLGDMVNRGPQNADVLRRLLGFGSSAQCAVYADIGIKRITPMSWLCRPTSATRLMWRRSLLWGRHNHSASKKASSLSLGRKRPGFVSIGAVLAKARSLIPKSACR